MATTSLEMLNIAASLTLLSPPIPQKMTFITATGKSAVLFGPDYAKVLFCPRCDPEQGDLAQVESGQGPNAQALGQEYGISFHVFLDNASGIESMSDEENTLMTEIQIAENGCRLLSTAVSPRLVFPAVRK
jgi:hypothetical protein